MDLHLNLTTNTSKIKKRNGTLVPYDGKRIVTAILKAMKDSDTVDKTIAEEIEAKIYHDVQLNFKVFSVEEISDLVEEYLMDFGMSKAAKSYISYRIRRASERSSANEPKYKFLSKEFLNNYKHADPPMTELGTFVYYRTYSRYLPEKKRREYWWETVARAVDYNCSIAPGATRKEAEELYDNIFNLRQFLSGRTLWSGGTKTAYTNPISQYNCSGLVIDDFDAYKDICYLLMLGVGVGFNVQKQYVNQLPKVRGDIEVVHKNYSSVPRKQRKESTEFNTTGTMMEIIVGDSKLGWANAIDMLIKVFYSIDFAHINFVYINYDNVRPHGEPLKTFGGTASGHEALLTILDKITKVLLKDNEGKKKLTPLEAMDIANIIAEGIVVGGKYLCLRRK